MNSTSVANAQTQLALAEAEHAKKRRTQLIDQLKSTRAELRAKRAAFDKLAKRIMQAQEDLNAVYSNQVAVITALGQLQDAKPAIADFCPDEPETLEWEGNVRILSERLEKLKVARLALGSVERWRMDAVQLREKIQQLQFSESSLLGHLDGSISQGRVGGVFAV